MTEIDLNKPAFTLTIGELIELIKGLLHDKVEVKSQIPRPPIKGIQALAIYLGVCPAKAQSLKNKGIITYFQNDRTVLFNPDKVDEIMKLTSK